MEGDTREREGKSISPFSAFISCTTKVFRKHTGWATSVQMFGSPRRIGGIIADIEAHFVHQASRRTWSMHSWIHSRRMTCVLWVLLALEGKEFDLLSQHGLVYHDMSRGYEDVYKDYMGQTKVISSLRHMTETRFSPFSPLDSVRTSMVPPYLRTCCLF